MRLHKSLSHPHLDVVGLELAGVLCTLSQLLTSSVQWDNPFGSTVLMSPAPQWSLILVRREHDRDVSLWLSNSPVTTSGATDQFWVSVSLFTTEGSFSEEGGESRQSVGVQIKA